MPNFSSLAGLEVAEKFVHGGGQGCTKLVSVVSRIPDKLLIVRQITLKITTKKVGPKSKLLT